MIYLKKSMLSFSKYFFQCYQIVNFMIYLVTLTLQNEDQIIPNQSLFLAEHACCMVPGELCVTE